MGTYRQPSQVIDKSFDTLNQGLENVNQQIGNELRFQRAQEIARAKEAKKEQEKKDKELKNLRDRQQAAIDGYQVNIDNWEGINQKRTDDWQQEDVSIQNQLKNNAQHYLDIMGDNLPDTEAYRGAERAIKNMITQYPVMAALLNGEAKEVENAYINGEWIKEGNDGAILNSDDPYHTTKKNMLLDIAKSSNPDRFQVITTPSGFDITYTGEDGKEFNLNANDYKSYKEGGNDLVSTVNGKEFDTFIGGIWGELKEDWKPVQTKIIDYRKELNEKGKLETIKFTDVENSYTQARENVKRSLDDWFNKGATITQSEWQMLGGEGVYSPDENKKEARDLLTKKIENKYLKEEDNYTLSEQEILQGGGSSSEKGEEAKIVSYDKIMNDAAALKKSLDNPNVDPKTGKRITKEQIEAGEFERLSATDKRNKKKLTDDLKARFEGSGFATGSGTKIIQDIEIKYKDGELFFFPQVNYATAGKDEDLKTLKEYSSGIPLTNERLLKFEKQIKQIAKDSVVSTGVGASFNN